MPASWHSWFHSCSSPWGCMSCSGTATVTPFPPPRQPLAERDQDAVAVWRELGMALPSPKSCLSLPKAFDATDPPLHQGRSLGASPRARRDADVVLVRLPKALPSGWIVAHTAKWLLCPKCVPFPVQPVRRDGEGAAVTGGPGVTAGTKLPM